MVTDLLVPDRRIVVPKPPSYIKFDGALGLGTGAKLGDKSRYRSHGTISGASWAAGLHGYCLDFDASAKDYVEIPASHTQLNFTSEDFSTIARIYIDDLTANECIYVRGVLSGDGIYFRVDATGRLNLWTSQSGEQQRTYSPVVTIGAGAWYTVGFSRADASVTLYRNGGSVNEWSGSHIDPATCARSAKIGIDDELTNFPFDGKIEFLRVFGGIALSTSEHLAWHNALK